MQFAIVLAGVAAAFGLCWMMLGRRGGMMLAALAVLAGGSRAWAQASPTTSPTLLPAPTYGSYSFYATSVSNFVTILASDTGGVWGSGSARVTGWTGDTGTMSGFIKPPWLRGGSSTPGGAGWVGYGGIQFSGRVKNFGTYEEADAEALDMNTGVSAAVTFIFQYTGPRCVSVYINGALAGVLYSVAADSDSAIEFLVDKSGYGVFGSPVSAFLDTSNPIQAGVGAYWQDIGSTTSSTRPSTVPSTEPTSQPTSMPWVHDTRQLWWGEDTTGDGEPQGIFPLALKNAPKDFAHTQVLRDYVLSWAVPSDTDFVTAVGDGMEQLYTGSSTQAYPNILPGHSLADLLGGPNPLQTLQVVVNCWETARTQYAMMLGLLRVLGSCLIAWATLASMVNWFAWAMGWRDLGGAMSWLWLRRSTGLVEPLEVGGGVPLGSSHLTAMGGESPWTRPGPVESDADYAARRAGNGVGVVPADGLSDVEYEAKRAASVSDRRKSGERVSKSGLVERWIR